MPRQTHEDLTGMKYGKLTAISFHSKNAHRQSLWNCKCDCGNEKVILAPSLKSGATVSCGCHNIEKTRERFTKHGHRKERNKTAAYATWAQMMNRCYNERTEKYHHYGGRGIKVCDRWHDFPNFFADMGERPAGKISLDRINSDGNYEPNNCRWADYALQNQNKPATNAVGCKGVAWNKQCEKWQARIRVNGMQKHLGLFDDLKDAVKARKDAEIKYGYGQQT